jgi:hypothetical protein
MYNITFPNCLICIGYNKSSIIQAVAFSAAVKLLLQQFVFAEDNI